MEQKALSNSNAIAKPSYTYEEFMALPMPSDEEWQKDEVHDKWFSDFHKLLNEDSRRRAAVYGDSHARYCVKCVKGSVTTCRCGKKFATTWEHLQHVRQNT